MSTQKSKQGENDSFDMELSAIKLRDLGAVLIKSVFRLPESKAKECLRLELAKRIKIITLADFYELQD